LADIASNDCPLSSAPALMTLPGTLLHRTPDHEHECPGIVVLTRAAPPHAAVWRV